MKKILFFVSLTAFCLAGCLDSQEDVTINGDGSGIYKTTVDMSGLFDMLQMAAMMDTSANSEMKNFADKDIDSTVLLRSFTDTSSRLSADEKALLQDGTMHLKVNQKDKMFKITMTYPFKKMDDLQKVLDLQKSDKGFNPFGADKKTPALGDMGEGGLPSPDKLLDITYKNGLIERKIDQQKLAESKKDQSEDLKNAGAMLDGITFGTVIHLPKPVKSVTGEKLTVSDDKRTVRIKYTLQDLMNTPEKLEFKVEY